jgi:hypothetical protein
MNIGEFPPGFAFPGHQTGTVDSAVVLAGEIALELDDGERVCAGRGRVAASPRQSDMCPPYQPRPLLIRRNRRNQSFHCGQTIQTFCRTFAPAPSINAGLRRLGLDDVWFRIGRQAIGVRRWDQSAVVPIERTSA